MYYSYPCSYCGKLFFTFNRNKEHAAQTLYEGIKAHLIEYNEDHKEYQFDDAPQIEETQMYYNMTEGNTRPLGGYEL
jgi:hypothetical protein